MTIKNTAEGNLHKMKGIFDEVIGDMTNTDRREYQGDAERLASHLQEKYDLSYEDARLVADQVMPYYC